MEHIKCPKCGNHRKQRLIMNLPDGNRKIRCKICEHVYIIDSKGMVIPVVKT